MNEGSATVNCSVYRMGKKLREIPIDDISTALEQDATFVWLGLVEPDAELMHKVQEEFCLHDLAVEDAQNAHQRAKLEEYGDTLFVVLHTAMLVELTIHYGETHVFVGPRFVITVRHGQSTGYSAVRERTENTPSRLASGPGYVLYSIVGIIYAGETYKNAVKLTFAKGASLDDPAGLFNSSLEGNTRRAIDIHEDDKIDEPGLKTLFRAAVA